MLQLCPVLSVSLCCEGIKKREEARLKNRLHIKMMIQQKQHSECAIKGLHKVTDFLSNGREGKKVMMQSKGKMGEEER